MKIALCLSGQPRYLDEGYEQINRNLLSKYDIDCFVHTWWDDSMKNESMVLSPNLNYGRKYIWKENTLETIVKYYSPKIFMHQKQIEFDTFDYIDYGPCFPQYVHSMFYSIMMCNNLKKIYEKENNFIYDVVIKSRFDAKFNRFNIDLEKLDMNYLYAQHYREHITDDKFIISSSKNMDVYSSAFKFFEQYSKDPNFNYRDSADGGYKMWVGENILSHHLYDKNVKVFHMNESQILSSNIGNT
jgi:hypothetical protein